VNKTGKKKNLKNKNKIMVYGKKKLTASIGLREKGESP
jgi:hypothetical protein